MAGKPVVILGVFVADTAYRADRQPRMGETILGNSFKLGPGGKGSNQAVAAGKLGADTTFLTRLGVDAFADMAKHTWQAAGVKAAVIDTPESYTGAAYIFVEETSGNNAIIVSPGAAMLISHADIEAHAGLIRSAGVFITQLEQPIEAALKALEIAREAGVTTILNPAPAARLPDRIYALCDYVTPNETEAEELTGIKVSSIDDARRAA
ncbi:MAG: ribokinase, partial [Mesorhizobium sp.]